VIGYITLRLCYGVGDWLYYTKVMLRGWWLVILR